MFDKLIERVLARLDLRVRDLATCRWESLEDLMNEKRIIKSDQAAVKRFFDEAVLHF
jgi:hypothetical protein